MRRSVDLLVWMLLVPSLLLATDPSQQAAGATVECPQKCVCYNGTMQVRCMFLKLIQVPRVPANVTVL